MKNTSEMTTEELQDFYRNRVVSAAMCEQLGMAKPLRNGKHRGGTYRSKKRREVIYGGTLDAS